MNEGPILEPRRARERVLVSRGLALVHATARRIHGRARGTVELEELVSLGCVAMLDAVDCFDPARSSFETYLGNRISWAMLDETRRRGRRLRRLRRAAPWRRALLVERAQQRARGATATPGAVRVVFESPQRDDEDADTRADERRSPEDALLLQAIIGEVGVAMTTLPAPARHLLARHYWDGVEIERIADELGLSRSAASRLHGVAVASLRLALRHWVERDKAAAPVTDKAGWPR
jgi:RNA polymerase sigma factor for flagellar operon FliA